MRLRPETDADFAAVRAVVEAAFGQPDEADLVAALRRDGDAEIALVAEEGGEVFGHVMLSRMRSPAGALGLAPVSVAPGRQRAGLGVALVREALERAHEAGWGAVFVLGDPAYYTRFGFETALARGYETAFAGPQFMAMNLKPEALSGAGPLAYARAFDDLD